MTSQRTRDRMVARLREKGIRDEVVLAAMAAIPRHIFIEEALASRAYEDTALPIGFEQTISQPFVVARMIEALRGKASLGNVLEIGTGCGYNAALLAEIVGPDRVVSIERLPELADLGRANLAACGYRVEVVIGDGTKGHASRAPYDCVIATAGAPRIPKPWMEQTKVGGRIIAPIGRSRLNQTLVTARKTSDSKWEYKEGTPCAFVPLIGSEGWRD